MSIVELESRFWEAREVYMDARRKHQEVIDEINELLSRMTGLPPDQLQNLSISSRISLIKMLERV